MENKPEEDSGILFPILYALLGSVGVFTIIMIAGIIFTYKNPAEQVIDRGNYYQVQIDEPDIPVQDRQNNQVQNGLEGREEQEKTPSKNADTAGTEPQPVAASEPVQEHEPISKPESKQSDVDQPEQGIDTESKSNLEQLQNTNSAGKERRSNWKSGAYLGSTESDRYHDYECRAAKNILSENEVWFSSEKEAQAAGYSRCGICWR